MPRNLPTQLLNNLQGKKIKIAFLVKIFLEQNNKILLTTHSRNVIYENEEYLFAKNLLVEGVNQTQKLQNQETQLSLTGIPDSFIVNGQTIYTTNLLLSTKFAGKQVLVYQAYFDLVTDQLIIDPTLLTDGIIISSSFADGINENMEELLRLVYLLAMNLPDLKTKTLCIPIHLVIKDYFRMIKYLIRCLL